MYYDVIYLIPDENSYVWCEDPAPGIGMEEEDAIKYIRADLVEKRKAQQKDSPDPKSNIKLECIVCGEDHTYHDCLKRKSGR